MTKLYLYRKVATPELLKRNAQEVKANENFSPKVSYILKAAAGMKNIRFLDIGCQMGEYIYHLSKHENFSFLKGIDIEKEYIDLGKKYFIDGIKNAELKLQNLFDIKNEKYDMVFMSEVIEHVDNPMAYVKKIYSLMNKNGVFIITTPNAIGITNILLNLKHFKDLRYIEHEKRGIGAETDHYYCWDKLTLFRLCNDAGFEFVECHTTRKFRPISGQSIIMIVKKP